MYLQCRLLCQHTATLHRGLHDAPPRDCGVSAQVQRQEETESECVVTVTHKYTHTQISMMVIVVCVSLGSYPHNDAGVQELFR